MNHLNTQMIDTVRHINSNKINGGIISTSNKCQNIGITDE